MLSKHIKLLLTGLIYVRFIFAYSVLFLSNRYIIFYNYLTNTYNMFKIIILHNSIIHLF